jgi:glycine/D-amino acid oxidase-like deaminating enzyme
MSIDRRSFLKIAGAHTGLLVGASMRGVDPRVRLPQARAQTAPHTDVAVIGAGAFGGWTALYLREMGLRVTLIDQYGPGNSRATSGDETRGIRTGYGERIQWTRLAHEAIGRWRTFDETWGTELRMRLFFPCGDLIVRSEWDNFLASTKRSQDAVGVGNEVLSIEEVNYRWPQIRTDGYTVALLEHDAGVGRARRSCECVAEVFRRLGGNVVIARALPGKRYSDRLDSIELSPGGPLVAQAYVFALGPWFPKVFPDLMTRRLRTSMGHVYYFGTPPGDHRFTWPNMPTYNFPGVTGFPALGPDNRGFRVRTGGRGSDDPDTAVRWIPENYHEAPRRVLTERFPDMATAPLLETRACYYEFTANRNFLIDRHPDYENVWLVGGGNAEGFKMGPVLGQHAAEIIVSANGDAELAESFRLGDAEYSEEGGRRGGRGGRGGGRGGRGGGDGQRGGGGQRGERGGRGGGPIL